MKIMMRWINQHFFNPHFFNLDNLFYLCYYLESDLERSLKSKKRKEKEMKGKTRSEKIVEDLAFLLTALFILLFWLVAVEVTDLVGITTDGWKAIIAILGIALGLLVGLGVLWLFHHLNYLDLSFNRQGKGIPVTLSDSLAQMRKEE